MAAIGKGCQYLQNQASIEDSVITLNQNTNPGYKMLLNKRLPESQDHCSWFSGILDIPTRLLPLQDWNCRMHNTNSTLISCMCAKPLRLCPTLRSYGLLPTRVLCPGDTPGKNAGVGYHALLQGIFPIQGSNPHLLYLTCISRRVLYH